MIDFENLKTSQVTYSDFKAGLQALNPARCVLLITKAIESHETYFSPGMLTRVTGHRIHQEGSEHEHIEVFTNFAEFELHNDQYDQPNWIGTGSRSGEEGLTAKESGWFPKDRNERIYIDKGCFDKEPVFVKVMSELVVAENTDFVATFIGYFKDSNNDIIAKRLEKLDNPDALDHYMTELCNDIAMDIFMKGAGSRFAQIEHLTRRYLETRNKPGLILAESSNR